MIAVDKRALVARSRRAVLGLALLTTTTAALLTQPTAQAASQSADPLAEVSRQHVTKTEKDLTRMAENKTPPGSAEMVAAKTLTTRVLAIGRGKG